MTARRIVLGAALAAVFLGTVAMAVEEPAFKPVLKDGAFEVRDYPALVVAEVTVSGDQKQAAGDGFRLLAGYIFGGNRTKQSIAMTAPVVQAPVSQKIAMTAPVTQIQGGKAWVVRFSMPSAYSLETLPTPNDPRVQLRRLPPDPLCRAALFRPGPPGHGRRPDRRARKPGHGPPDDSGRPGLPGPVQSALDARLSAALRGDDPHRPLTPGVPDPQ